MVLSIFRTWNYGPQYRGVIGGIRKMGEHAIGPGVWPWATGIFLTVPMLSSIPMSEYNLEQSKIFNRKEIMNETKRKTGAYYAH